MDGSPPDPSSAGPAKPAPLNPLVIHGALTFFGALVFTSVAIGLHEGETLSLARRSTRVVSYAESPDEFVLTISVFSALGLAFFAWPLYALIAAIRRRLRATPKAQ